MNTGKVQQKKVASDKEKDVLESSLPDVLTSSIRAAGHVLGKGRHSTVYEGWMTGSGKRVCIKEDKRNPLDEKSYEAIREKVNTLRKLQHPSIAGILDYVQDFENKRTYIIMPYVHGSGLNQLLYDRGSFSVGKVLDWTCQLLDALRYLHNQRIIHGEIRPSSMVLTAEAERVCLVDFNHVSFPVVEVRLDVPVDNYREPAFDEDSVVLHKFQYSLDENDFRQGVSRDIYRTGATMYELLTGVGVSQKSGADTLDELKDKEQEWKAKGKPRMLKAPDVSLLKALGVPPAVIQVILKATALNPKDRYQSAEEMLGKLRELPKIDERRTAHMRLAVIGGVASAATLLLGAFLLFTGLNQIRRTSEMKNQATEVVEKLQAGNYTAGEGDGAVALALQATARGLLDPPVAPEAQAALSDAISAYDYIAGYKPARSVALAGNPIQAHFSADGTWVAVLVGDAAKPQNNNRRIYVYKTDTGELACPPLVARFDSDFAFTNDNKLFYIGSDSAILYSVTDKTESWKLPTGDIGSSAVTVSGDGTKAAVLVRGASEAYLYDTDTGQNWSFSLLSPSDNSDTASPLDKPNSQTEKRVVEPLFALNHDGTILAASLPDGSMWLYQLFGKEVAHRAGLCPANPAEARFLRFEGGFCGDEFFYSAAMTNEIVQYFNSGVYHLANFDWSSPPEKPDVSLNAYEEIHVQADEYGIYASVGGSLQYYDTEIESWTELALEDTGIKLLRHGGKRLLAVTETGGLVLVYREDGSWRTETSRGTAYHLAGISETHLFLSQKNRAMLSLLDWREPEEEDVLFTYAPHNDPDTYYEHDGAAVRSDKQSAVLYSTNGFRVYSFADGSFQEYAFTNPDNVTAVYYLRNPQVSRGEPAEECLQALHYDGSSVYYSLQDGHELAARTVQADDESRAVISFHAGTYRAEQMSGGAIRFFHGGKQVSRPQSGTLVGATQKGETLIVNFRDSNGQYYSLFLDKNMNVTAHLPQPCEALPDGTLVFDDRQGHLLRGAWQSLEDLRGRAKKWGRKEG